MGMTLSGDHGGNKKTGPPPPSPPCAAQFPRCRNPLAGRGSSAARLDGGGAQAGGCRLSRWRSEHSGADTMFTVNLSRLECTPAACSPAPVIWPSSGSSHQRGDRRPSAGVLQISPLRFHRLAVVRENAAFRLAKPGCCWFRPSAGIDGLPATSM